MDLQKMMSVVSRSRRGWLAVNGSGTYIEQGKSGSVGVATAAAIVARPCLVCLEMRQKLRMSGADGATQRGRRTSLARIQKCPTWGFGGSDKR